MSTLAVVKAQAASAGAVTAGTLAGRVPLAELLADAPEATLAALAWSFVPGDPYSRGDDRIGHILGADPHGRGLDGLWPVYGGY